MVTSKAPGPASPERPRAVWFPAIGLVIAGLAATAWVASPNSGRPGRDAELGAGLQTWVGQEILVFLDAGRRPQVGSSGGRSTTDGGMVIDEQSQPIGAQGRLVQVSETAIVLESARRVWISRDRIVAIEPVPIRDGQPRSVFFMR